jgi:hypothetical protein
VMVAKGRAPEDPGPFLSCYALHVPHGTHVENPWCSPGLCWVPPWPPTNGKTWCSAYPECPGPSPAAAHGSASVWAIAVPAKTTIIAAMTNATLTNKMMRFKSATSFLLKGGARRSPTA